jgi:hypothetical protein
MVMTRLGLVGLGLLAAGILTACSAGTDFKRPDAATFQLGRTTEKEIRERFGEPRSQATIQANERTIKVLRYVYAEAAPYVEKVPACSDRRPASSSTLRPSSRRQISTPTTTATPEPTRRRSGER